MSETLVKKSASLKIAAGRRVGTICLRQPCALCDRPFDVQNGAQVVTAHDDGGGRAGLVCPRCASKAEEELREQMLERAERLREKADRLARWAEGGIQTDIAGEPAGSRQGAACGEL